MSKVIALTHPKWMYWPDGIAHIYKVKKSSNKLTQDYAAFYNHYNVTCKLKKPPHGQSPHEKNIDNLIVN